MKAPFSYRLKNMSLNYPPLFGALPLYIKVYGYTSMFFCHCYKGERLFTFLDHKALLKTGLLLKERINSLGSQFYPVTVHPKLRKGQK